MAWTTFECEECGRVEEFDLPDNRLTEGCPSCGERMTSELSWIARREWPQDAIDQIMIDPTEDPLKEDME